MHAFRLSTLGRNDQIAGIIQILLIMDKQLSRINSFVTTLVNNEFTNGQMAMVLSAECDVVGGANGTCTNKGGSMSCRGENSNCDNSGVCSNDNDICENFPPTKLEPFDPGHR